jgi:hypothetical protein
MGFAQRNTRLSRGPVLRRRSAIRKHLKIRLDPEAIMPGSRNRLSAAVFEQAAALSRSLIEVARPRSSERGMKGRAKQCREEIEQAWTEFGNSVKYTRAARMALIVGTAVALWGAIAAAGWWFYRLAL